MTQSLPLENVSHTVKLFGNQFSLILDYGDPYQRNSSLPRGIKLHQHNENVLWKAVNTHEVNQSSYDDMKTMTQADIYGLIKYTDFTPETFKAHFSPEKEREFIHFINPGASKNIVDSILIRSHVYPTIVSGKTVPELRGTEKKFKPHGREYELIAYFFLKFKEEKFHAEGYNMTHFVSINMTFVPMHNYQKYDQA